MECHDANGGKHRFRTALPNQLLRTFQGKKLYIHGIALAGNVKERALGRVGEVFISSPPMAARSSHTRFSGRAAGVGLSEAEIDRFQLHDDYQQSVFV